MGKPDDEIEELAPPPEPAEVAYNAYCNNRGWKAFNGDPLPQWPDVKDDIKAGWRAAIDAVKEILAPQTAKHEVHRLAANSADVEMPLLTEDQINTMDLEEACSQLGNRVYKVCLLFEQLEHRGVVRGNGHHAAQHISKLAETELRERWITPDPAPAATPTTKT